MDEVERCKVFEVVITGGEPLLNKSGLYQMLDRAESSGTAATINTSLLGLTESDAEKLSAYKCLRNVLTSIIGPNAEIHDSISGHQGSFDKTLRGVALLRKHNVPVSANMVVSQLNKVYISQTAELCKRIGIRVFNATRATCPTNCPDFSQYSLDLKDLRGCLDELAEAGKSCIIPVGALTVYPLCGVRDVRKYPFMFGKRCSAGVTVVGISARGEVHACTHIPDSAGNVFTTPLDEIWASLSEWRDGTLLPGVCKDCKALAICGGGCRADAQAVNGSLCGLDPLMSETDVDVAVENHLAYLQESESSIELPQTLSVNPNLKHRSEPFGSVCFLGAGCAGILNPDATELIFTELSGKTVTSTELLGIIPEEFLTNLVRQKILVAADQLACA
jgi:pyrroloquinoline quinone biosynthesis protein E